MYAGHAFRDHAVHRIGSGSAYAQDLNGRLIIKEVVWSQSHDKSILFA
jgi:hypothetical protein